MRQSARATALASTALAPAARAETAYRYWTYWSVADGAWHFSTIGPASAVPVDGAVEGWRFTITTAMGSSSDAPDLDAATAFTSLCSDTVPRPGMKRVALAIDFGMPADAPLGERPPVDIWECVAGPDDATGYELLRSITNVRVGDGLVCGIAGYPATECAELVEAQPSPATGMGTEPAVSVAALESTPSTGPLISGVGLLAVAVISLLAWRRRGHR